MSDFVKSCMIEESRIVVTIEVPVNFDADAPLEHLENEGNIEQGVLAAGRAASQSLFQTIADRHNAVEKYRSADGYTLRQKYQSTEKCLSPYGHIAVTAPYFCNDYRHQSDRPFERETFMEEHHITPMAQYVLLRMLAKDGPQATARDFEEERGVHVSHHLVDEFLEDMGLKYQDLRTEFLDEVVREDWRPSWRPCLLPERPTAENESGGGDFLPRLSDELGKEIMPVVQIDAMRLGVREYEERILDGKRNLRKYKVEFHELHNAFIGFQALGGPRETNDPLEFHEVRYMSEYHEPFGLPLDVAGYVRACGVQPGAKVLCMGDGDKSLWPNYRTSFKDFEMVPILDTRHCRSNLRLFIQNRFPDDEGRQNQWVTKRMDDLFEGRYSSFFNALNYAARNAPSEEAQEEMKSKRKYFRRNAEGIRYRDFLDAGYPISTCFVESAHNHVIGIKVRKNGRTCRDDRLQMIADFRSEYKSHRLPYVFQRIMEVKANDAA